jgi:hypothetical protein
VGIDGKGEPTQAADTGMPAHHISFKEAARGAVDNSEGRS